MFYYRTGSDSLRELFSTMDLDWVTHIQTEDLVNQAKAELASK